MRSIDVTFDVSLEAAVRAEWAALADAGLPSLASHAGASNRPHITLAAGDDLTLSGSPRYAPFVIRLGAVVLFPRRSGFVLARSVVPATALLALHESVHSHLAGALDHTRVGSWSPHVTLSRRVSGSQLEAAVEVLGEPAQGLVEGLRLWDSKAGAVTELADDGVS
jgi:2'-5' RNA ligase